MAATIRACWLCYSRSIDFTHRGELLRQLFKRLNADRNFIRYLGTTHVYWNKGTDTSQVCQTTAIPVDKLKITYSRSSGPGGQHVNKVNSKAEVRFHVQTAEWIPDEVRNVILLKNKTRINKAGELIVTSEVSRSQNRNLENCLHKITEIISEASQMPAEPSTDDVALRAQRLERRNLARLKEKKIHSATKRARQVDFD
ncbi:large ribosomal subunit protein mL62 [Brachyhypopomus gauderio]|uniref:large ribosomal subunit protein mL62 n=1 Tax=Brachyhypopomus gauderio TaxID=698409 RepID=UPI004041A157